jgi:hypothetical protein
MYETIRVSMKSNIEDKSKLFEARSIRTRLRAEIPS